MYRIRIDSDNKFEIVSKWKIIKWFLSELFNILCLSPDGTISIRYQIQVTWIKFTAIK